MAGKSLIRTIALLAALAIIPVGAMSAIKTVENGDAPMAKSGGPSPAQAPVSRVVPASNAPDAVSMVDYEVVPFNAATDTTPLLNQLVQSGAKIWELPPFIPDPAPLAIFGLGLLAVGFLRLFRTVR